MVINQEEITVTDIDEAIAHLAVMLKDQYGNRLTHQRKVFLMGELDSLLDARLEVVNEGGSGEVRELESRPEQCAETFSA